MSRTDLPPTHFDDAEKINTFQALIDLHAHATGRPLQPSRSEALAELALSAAVVAWWSRWQPIMIHTALRAGTDLTDIAAATGLDVDEVIHRGSGGLMSRRAWSSADTLCSIRRRSGPSAGASRRR
ncbi:hypothetical protein ABZ738_23975 [Micromonospora sp. NPDC047793]|uniref:hypothetical protein n=1 Tax=Micromonospora sp. NPDC047793 TaxID=3154342 RepID=UPI0033F52733